MKSELGCSTVPIVEIEQSYITTSSMLSPLYSAISLTKKEGRKIVREKAATSNETSGRESRNDTHGETKLLKKPASRPAMKPFMSKFC